MNGHACWVVHIPEVQQGEWHLEKPSGNLYYIPYKEEKIKDAKIYAPYSLQVISVEEQLYL